jgi:hypothetical protein
MRFYRLDSKARLFSGFFVRKPLDFKLQALPLFTGQRLNFVPGLFSEQMRLE